jgi:hypothetical protein
MRRALDYVPVVLGIALLSTLVALQWHRIVYGENDFVAFYAGGKLVGTSGLYSRPANDALIKSILGTTMENVRYIRPPFYAALLKPLTFLPYLAAYGVFNALCLSSIVWFVIRFSRSCGALPLYSSFSIPISASFLGGQDTPLLLVFIGASILLSRRKKEFLAGLVFSLCAIKFHLFLFIILLLVIKKRWRILAGAASGSGALFALGFIVAGKDSLGQWLNVLRDPWINFSAAMMPNLHGLITSLHGGSGLEIAAAAFVGLLFVWICQRSENYEFLFGLGLLCGLLTSFHSGIADEILLLVVFVLIMGSSEYKPLRIALAIAITPLPYFVPAPLSIILPISLLLVLAFAAASMARGMRAAEPCAAAI